MEGKREQRKKCGVQCGGAWLEGDTECRGRRGSSGNFEQKVEEIQEASHKNVPETESCSMKRGCSGITFDTFKREVGGIRAGEAVRLEVVYRICPAVAKK